MYSSFKAKLISIPDDFDSEGFHNFQGSDEFLFWFDENTETFYILPSDKLINTVLNKD